MVRLVRKSRRMRTGAGGVDRRRGFTLVEVMVSMVLLLFISLALVRTALINIEINARNAIRDEATHIATAQLDALRNADAIANIAGENAGPTVTRTIRNIDVDYRITTIADEIAEKYWEISVRVDWDWKGEVYNTTMTTLRKE